MNDPTHTGDDGNEPSGPWSTGRNRGKHAITIAISALVGLSMFAAIVYIAGPERISTIRSADPAWAGFAVVAGLGVTTTSTYRWGLLTNILGGRKVLPWIQYYAALLSSRVLGLFVPRNASDIGVRIAVLMGPGGMRGEFATASLALDQMYDIVLLGVWLVPSVLLLTMLPIEWAAVLVPLVLVVSLALMMGLHTVIRWVARLLQRIAVKLTGSSRTGQFFDRRAHGLEKLADIEHFSARQSLQLGSATILRYALNALMFWGIAQSLSLDVDLWFFLLAGAIVQLSLVVAFTPGGLGLLDLGWVGTLAIGGYDTATGAAFIVGMRAFQYLFFPALAAASYLVVAMAKHFKNGSIDSEGPQYG